MNKKKIYIFFVFSPIIEILVTRIIVNLLEKKSISKKEILIIHPKEYKPCLAYDIKKICFDPSLSSEIYKNDRFNRNLYLKVQYYLYLFRRKFNKFGKRVYGRLGKLPVSFYKISAYFSFIQNLNLKNKEPIVYTPNVKIHIFQVLIFYTRNYNYHLLEEGSGSFKSLKDTEHLISFDIKLLIADLISAIIFNSLIISRLFYDVIKMIFLNRRIPIKQLIKYLKTPIFSGGMFFLNKIKPLTLNKITEDAFSDFYGFDSFFYERKSYYEEIKLKEIRKLIKQKAIKELYIYILPGDNINILKNEFDKEEIKNVNSHSFVIRPHPRLSKYNIKYLAEILDIEISNNYIDLSEQLKIIPIELLNNLKEFKLVFLGTQKSSLLLYCNKRKN